MGDTTVTVGGGSGFGGAAATMEGGQKTILGSSYESSVTDEPIVGAGASSTPLYIMPGSTAGAITIQPGSPQDLALAQSAMDAAKSIVLGSEQSLEKMATQTTGTSLPSYGKWILLGLGVLITGGIAVYFWRKK